MKKRKLKYVGEEDLVRSVDSDYELDNMRQEVEEKEEKINRKLSPKLKKHIVCFSLAMVGVLGGFAGFLACGFSGLPKKNDARESQKQILQKYDYDVFNQNLRQQKIDETMDKFYRKEISKSQFDIEYKEAESYTYDPVQFVQEKATAEEWKQYQASQEVIDSNSDVMKGLGVLAGGLVLTGASLVVGYCDFSGNKNKKSSQSKVDTKKEK